MYKIVWGFFPVVSEEALMSCKRHVKGKKKSRKLVSVLLKYIRTSLGQASLALALPDTNCTAETDFACINNYSGLFFILF